MQGLHLIGMAWVLFLRRGFFFDFLAPTPSSKSGRRARGAAASAGSGGSARLAVPHAVFLGLFCLVHSVLTMADALSSEKALLGRALQLSTRPLRSRAVMMLCVLAGDWRGYFVLFALPYFATPALHDAFAIQLRC